MRRVATHPAIAWQRLGLQWAETLAASAEVFARRSTRANTPFQWMAMGNEKVQAALQSSNALALGMLSLPLADPAALWGASAHVLASGLRPYRTRVLRNARKRRRR